VTRHPSIVHAFGQALTCNSVSRGDIRVPPGTLLQLPSPFGEPLLLTCELSQPIGGRRASIGRLAKQRRQLPLRICQLPSLELEVPLGLANVFTATETALEAPQLLQRVVAAGEPAVRAEPAQVAGGTAHVVGDLLELPRCLVGTRLRF